MSGPLRQQGLATGGVRNTELSGKSAIKDRRPRASLTHLAHSVEDWGSGWIAVGVQVVGGALQPWHTVGFPVKHDIVGAAVYREGTKWIPKVRHPFLGAIHGLRMAEHERCGRGVRVPWSGCIAKDLAETGRRRRGRCQDVSCSRLDRCRVPARGRAVRLDIDRS